MYYKRKDGWAQVFVIFVNKILKITLTYSYSAPLQNHFGLNFHTFLITKSHGLVCHLLIVCTPGQRTILYQKGCLLGHDGSFGMNVTKCSLMEKRPRPGQLFTRFLERSIKILQHINYRG
jgi:hypothetical protein